MNYQIIHLSLVYNSMKNQNQLTVCLWVGQLWGAPRRGPFKNELALHFRECWGWQIPALTCLGSTLLSRRGHALLRQSAEDRARCKGLRVLLISRAPLAETAPDSLLTWLNLSLPSSRCYLRRHWTSPASSLSYLPRCFSQWHSSVCLSV